MSLASCHPNVATTIFVIVVAIVVVSDSHFRRPSAVSASSNAGEWPWHPLTHLLTQPLHHCH